MKRTLITLVSTTALGAGLFATSASANPALLIVPWAIGAAVGGVALGAGASAANHEAVEQGQTVILAAPPADDADAGALAPAVVYGSPSVVYAQPPARACRVETQWTNLGWRNVTVCG